MTSLHRFDHKIYMFAIVPSQHTPTKHTFEHPRRKTKIMQVVALRTRAVGFTQRAITDCVQCPKLCFITSCTHEEDVVAQPPTHTKPNAHQARLRTTVARTHQAGRSPFAGCNELITTCNHPLRLHVRGACEMMSFGRATYRRTWLNDRDLSFIRST